MRKRIYILNNKISFKTFKLLQEKLVKDSGPVPKEGDKAIWNLLRQKKIYCWFAPDISNDMGIGLEIPPRYKNYKVMVISSK